ncbi:MAG: triosephosphate isomerase [Actinomycetota bacterium]|jgi:triosephosphate isomerase|nr:triosephosphate isomerase [Actinomycetota bacterium]
MPDAGRKPIISGNWKMHCNHFEAIQLVQKISYAIPKQRFDAVDVSVHPPFTDIRSIQTVLDADKIPLLLGAQNCHWEEQGAFTGEVSPGMLDKLNVKLVIVGHSERRELFGETDEAVNHKAHAVFRHGMTPIVCVGETLAEREAGATEEKVTTQVTAALHGLSPDQASRLVLAYEPIWAIGTGRTASAEDAQAICALIRQLVGEQVSKDAAAAVRVQYGGSVKPTNIAELMAKPDIDGALVGGASLVADDFARIVGWEAP